MTGGLHTEPATCNAAANELGRYQPIHHSGNGIVQCCGQTESTDGEQRSADGIDHGHAGREDEARHNEKAPANPEEP